MSDGHATADQELSTSDTAVPSRGDKTHVLEPNAATLVPGDSTRGGDSAAAATIVAGEQGESGHADLSVEQTVVAPDDPSNGADGGDFRFGATVVADGGTGGAGFEMGATVVGGDDPAARATRVAGMQNSFDSATPEESEIHPGESLIGRFKIIRTLGEGSFGAVYLAEDPQLDRRVAIKVTKVGVLTTRSDVDRFQREAKAAAQLRHPNIVPVYEVGRIGRSSFLAYEYIEGTTLGSRLREKKKLSPREAAQVMYAIAGALGYAHELGIIHRDMKPDNVLLDKQGQPHIADFGLARRDSGEMDKTREGGLMGTPLYMSPEQASGRSHEADARADVWSLGVMLREMLTGVLPFQGKLTEILIGIQTAEPPSIRTLDSTLPRDLETICQKCLSKDPALRYANGTELAAELDRYLRGEPILSRPLSMPARAWRWMRRNPKEARWVAGTVFALVAGAAFSIYFGIDATESKADALAQAKERALSQLQSLKSASPGGLSTYLEFLAGSKDDIAAQLSEELSNEKLRAVERNRLLLAKITLFPVDSENEARLKEVARTLVTLSPEEVLRQVELLVPHADAVIPTLQQIAHQEGRLASEKQKALYALATLAPEAPNWDTDAAEIGAGLLAERTELPFLLKLVRPIRDRLRTAIEPFFSSSDQSVQIAAANVLADLFDDQPQFIYASLARRATPQQLRSLIGPIKGHQEHVTALARADLTSKPGASIVGDDALRMQTNAFLVLYSVASPDVVPWEVLRGGDDNTLRTEIIETLHQAVPEWEKAALRLESELDPRVRQGLLLALAHYPVTELTPEKRAALQTLSLSLYESDVSPGVHAAARQFIDKTGGSTELAAVLAIPVPLENRGDRRWYRNSHGQEFAVIEGPVEFLMGAPAEDIEQDERGFERQHRRLIPRSFAIGLHEVTVREFQAYDPAHFYNPAVSPEPECPITEMSWIDAAKYCRWLSEQDGVPPEEMCFPPIDEITVDMQLPPDVLARTGYRLPTAAEWEYACRAGTATSRWIGRRDQTPICAWYRDNSQGRTHPVGRKVPNGFGLFDTLGNAYEYCQDKFFGDYPVASEGQQHVIDGEDTRDGIDYELRGACYDFAVTDVRSSMRDGEGMTRDTIESRAGFRLARTVRVDQSSHDNSP